MESDKHYDVYFLGAMLLPHWGELMLYAFIPRALPTAEGFCPCSAVLVLRGEIVNRIVRGFGC